MKNIVLLFILFCFCQKVSAQDKSKNQQKDKKTEIKKETKTSSGFAPDSLFVITKGDLRYIRHKVRKGETVYSITRFYNIEIEKLKRNNPEFEKEGLKENQWLLIPINPKALIINKGKDFKFEYSELKVRGFISFFFN
jgi:LysM repeat protein